MTIDGIYIKKEISNKSYNICNINELHHVSDLIKYYNKNKSFKNLKHCGTKSNLELIDLCVKYQNENFENKEIKNNIHLKIDEIYIKKEISIRLYNICKINELHYISDLKKYYDKNKSFKKLQQCGTKSNLELIEFCNKYQKETREIKRKVNLKEVIFNLTRVQREVINSFILLNTNSLSIRSKNAISFNLKKNLTIKNFAEKVFFNSVGIKHWKNVGTKSKAEIELYLNNIKDFVEEVNESKEEKHLISLKNNFSIQRTFFNSKIPCEVLESDSIFILTDFFLNSYALFNYNETTIIKKAFKIYKNQKQLTLDDIADEVKLTRERVRQIRVVCLDELLKKLSFIQNINDDLFQKYNIDTNSDQIEINQELIDNINKANFTYLSREFISYILYIYLSEKFSLIGDIEDVLQPKYFNSCSRHNWNNFYLIEKELASEFVFTSFTNDISNRLSDRIEESYFFNFKSYLSKFLSNNNIDILDLLLPICEKIINEEFEIYLDLDENINFKRNTTRQAHEYAFEALDHLGKPSKVKEIFEKVLALHPNYDSEEAKIRASMKRKNGFVPIGRTSVFGLKKWESELDNFKGGTIRDIVEEYLMQFSVPKHTSHITEQVLKYRPKSNQRSILQNLKLDESGLYIFFQGSHIGLTTKKYKSDFKRISEIQKTDKKTWEERFEMLQNFVSIEKRLPFSNGVREKEIKLYRWLNVQKSKQNKGKLTENKEDKLNSLLAKYPSLNGRRRLNSNEKYQELISFVTNNHRLPSANKNGEENLYQFFYKQRKLFDKNELDSKEQNKFIEVAKLLQNIKYENKRN